MSIYEHCPQLLGDKYLMRLVTEEDCADLLKVYSDKAAVPLFNSDNCNGDNFHYATYERMQQGIRMWTWSYAHGWFVRWAVIDRQTGEVVGTVELCRQGKDWTRKGRGILRVDLRSDYERTLEIERIVTMLLDDAFDWFCCDQIWTKARPVAAERIGALEKLGFLPSPVPLMGQDGTAYDDYYVLYRES